MGHVPPTTLPSPNRIGTSGGSGDDGGTLHRTKSVQQAHSEPPVLPQVDCGLSASIDWTLELTPSYISSEAGRTNLLRAAVPCTNAPRGRPPSLWRRIQTPTSHAHGRARAKSLGDPSSPPPPQYPSRGPRRRRRRRRRRRCCSWHPRAPPGPPVRRRRPPRRRRRRPTGLKGVGEGWA